MKTVSFAKKAFLAVIIVNILALAVNIYHGYSQGDYLKHFQEGTKLTLFSSLQLLFIAVLCWLIFLKRYGSRRQVQAKAYFIVWALISIGFMLLAYDEYFQLHETIDHLIHSYFNMRETGWSDPIDDFLIAVYGLIGLGVIYSCREELKRFRDVRAVLTTAFVFLAGMVILDAVTNGVDVVADVSQRMPLELMEDVLKYLAEGLFLVCALICYNIEST